MTFTPTVAGSSPAAPIETKVCTRCGVSRLLSQFDVRKKSRDGRQVYCRECKAQYFQKNRTRLIPKIRAANKIAREKVAAYIDRYRDEHPCERCGESDSSALDFHHHDGAKEFGIGQANARGMSLRRVIEEIAKCRVLCASCHRKFHAGRFALEAR